MRGSRTHKLLAALLSLIFIGSLSWLTDWLWDSRQSGRAHEQAVRIAMEEPADEEPEAEVPALPSPVVIEVPDDAAPLAGTPAPEPIPEEAAHLAELDLEGLRQVSEDVLGWIHIPGSDISYPLMDSEDNRDYLELTWNGEKSRGGSIFLECRSSEDLSDFHTLIYGHNMKDGSMFAGLHAYTSRDFWEEHRYICFDTLTAHHTYEIFAVFTTTASEGMGFAYHDLINAATQEVFDTFVAKCLSLSLYGTELVPVYGDKIICLSTCEYSQTNGRLVVAAARIQ